MQGGLPYWAAFGLTVALSFVLGVAGRARSSSGRCEQAPVLSVVVGLHRAAGDLQQPGRLAVRLHHQAVSEPVPGAAAWFGNRYHVRARGRRDRRSRWRWWRCSSCFFRFTRARPGDARGGAEPGVGAAGRHRRRLDAGAGLGPGGAVGAVAGMLVAPVVFLDPNMMGGVLLYAFAGALVGGIDNPAGAVLGGFIVGVLENLIGSLCGRHRTQAHGGAGADRRRC